MAHLEETGAEGIGLFRTELQFMIVSTFPLLGRQTETYREIMDGAGGRPVVFRALDIGGDKALPYLRQPKEDNPAIGWRAIRLALDRPALFKLQVRALLRAAAGRELRLMIPMVSTAAEIDRAKELISEEKARAERRGDRLPEKMLLGAMIEVPSILLELDAVMSRVDFVSVGSNDLLQFLYAADRSNPLVAGRYDPLSVAALRALKMVQEAGERNAVPVTLCGEFAAQPLQAMALVGLGYRALSIAPASIGPVKKMIMSLDYGRIAGFVAERLHGDQIGDLRTALQRFAEGDSVEI
jgi:phosphotransferase system enzyme I (PtsP)